MGVSERDREQFRRIGEYKDATHREAMAEHLALSLAERLARSWALYVRFRTESPDRSEDDPAQLYARARRLGLIRS